MKPKILITGGKGFFASRLNLHRGGEFELFLADLPSFDITNADLVHHVVSAVSPDYIVHAAGITATNLCEGNPSLARKVNVEGSLHVAKAAKQVGARFIFFSSEQVFVGNEESGPYDETVVPVPGTVYGQTKLEAEEALKALLDSNLVILRPTWMFGLAELGCVMNPGVVQNVLDALVFSRELADKDNEFRGLAYVRDFVDNFDSLINLPFGTYHTGSVNDKSRAQITAYILSLLGRENTTDHFITTSHPKVKDVRLNTDKLTAHGVYFPPTTEAIRRALVDFGYIKN